MTRISSKVKLLNNSITIYYILAKEWIRLLPFKMDPWNLTVFLLLINFVSLSSSALRVNDIQGFLSVIRLAQSDDQGCYSSSYDIGNNIPCSKFCLSNNISQINYYELSNSDGNIRRCACKSEFDGMMLGSNHISVKRITPRAGR